MTKSTQVAKPPYFFHFSPESLPYYGTFTIYNGANRPVFEIVSSTGEMSNKWFMVDASRKAVYGIQLGWVKKNPVVSLLSNEKVVGVIRPGDGKLSDYYLFKTPKTNYIFRGHPATGEFELVSNLGKAMESKRRIGMVDQFAVKISTSRKPLLLLAGAAALSGFRLRHGMPNQRTKWI